MLVEGRFGSSSHRAVHSLIAGQQTNHWWQRPHIVAHDIGQDHRKENPGGRKIPSPTSAIPEEQYRHRYQGEDTAQRMAGFTILRGSRHDHGADFSSRPAF